MPWPIGVVFAIWILGVEYRLWANVRSMNIIVRKMGYANIAEAERKQPEG